MTMKLIHNCSSAHPGNPLNFVPIDNNVSTVVTFIQTVLSGKTLCRYKIENKGHLALCFSCKIMLNVYVLFKQQVIVWIHEKYANKTHKQNYKLWSRLLTFELTTFCNVNQIHHWYVPLIFIICFCLNPCVIVQVQGPGVLQLMKIRNVSAPKNNEESQGAPRLMKFSLTDGQIICSAVETEVLNGIGWVAYMNKQGTKILKISTCHTRNMLWWKREKYISTFKCSNPAS